MRSFPRFRYATNGQILLDHRTKHELGDDSRTDERADEDEETDNDDLPAERRKVIRESGTKLLELDDWLHEMYDSAEDTIKRCDELIAKVDALEARRGDKAEKNSEV